MLNPPSQNQNGQTFDYLQAGFDNFLQKSIEGPAASNLEIVVPNQPVSEISFDQTQINGMLGDKLQIGSIILDGSKGRISVFDANNNEIVRIGELDG